MSTYNLQRYTLIALVIGLLQGCTDNSSIKADKPLMVTTFVVQNPVETQYRNFKGTVVAADLTPLSFRLEGELDAILVRNGQHVKQGELLAKLDDSKQRQQLADARAQYELAVKQKNRAQDLINKRMISQSELDELTTTERIASVNFAVATHRLAYTRLLAPFSGYISAVPKQSFESVTPGETILTLYRDDVVRVRIGISNSVLATFNPDLNKQTYRVKTTFAGDLRSYFLRYYQNTSEPAAGESAFSLWLEMPQVEPAILPGTSASLDVDLVAAGLHVMTGYVVPMTALDAGNKKGEFYVWKLIDGKAHKQSIEIVQINKDGVVISEGLQRNDLLINSNLRRLRDNTSIATAEKEGK